MLLFTTAFALDCNGLDADLCQATNQVAAQVQAAYGQPLIGPDSPKARLRDTAVYATFAELSTLAASDSCTPGGSALAGTVGGRYRANGPWAGSWADLGGSGGSAQGTVRSAPPRFSGTYDGATTGAFGDGYASYTPEGRLSGNRDDGFVTGQWVRIQGRNGVFTTVYGDCDVDEPVFADFLDDPGTLGLDARVPNPSCLATDTIYQEDADLLAPVVFADLPLFDEPVAATQPPGLPDVWFVIEQPGVVKRFETSDPSGTLTTVATLPQVDTSANERGLLGIAFPPDFTTTGRAYLSYTGPNGRSRLSRFQTSNGGATWDLGSEQIFYDLFQPAGNHNGGHIAFGPDGMLYWSLGDGGGAGDPNGNGQNLGTPLGAVLRLDVSGADAGIPSDNPFVGVPGAREEIYAWGLRNPWRFSFDPLTGDLWLGDVGQGDAEEIDRIFAGGNYGWNHKEGFECFALTPCEGGYVDPVAVYRDSGRSVTGGVVYRGTAIPELYGRYIFADYIDGDFRTIDYDADGVGSIRKIRNTGRNIAHIENGLDGEIYAVDRGGRIIRLERASEPPSPSFPQTLSATGCFSSTDPLEPAPWMVPYELNHPFWSDGAYKTRWMALPDGTSATIGADGDLSFPAGTVLAKHFTVDGQPVETRLFMNHTTDGWAGYTYKWRSDGSDADLIPASDTVTTSQGTWVIPDRGACMQCHSAVAGRSLGLESRQLDRIVYYPQTGRSGRQLPTLAHLGLVTGTPSSQPAFVGREATSDLEQAARTLLHANCSHCHQPGGPGVGDLDLRIDTPLDASGLCDAPTYGDLGIPGARIVDPGSPTTSVLSGRMHTRDAYAMPPIGTAVVDALGTSTIDAWITSLSSCP